MEQTETATLDVRGEICPYPMLRTNRELDESDPKPNALEVITDHPPALSTIPPEAMKRGYGCEIEEIKPGAVSYTHLQLPTICRV